MKVYTDGQVIWGLDNSAIAVVIERKVKNKNGNFKKKIYTETFIEKKAVKEVEYLALIKALKLIKGDAEIFSDCKNMIDEINGKSIEGTITYEKVFPLLNEVEELLKVKSNVTINWISRESNLAGKVLEKRLPHLKKYYAKPRISRRGRYIWA